MTTNDGANVVQVPENAHRNSGQCAEIVATALVVIDTGRLPWQDREKPPKIIAWGVGQDLPFIQVDSGNWKDGIVGSHQNPCGIDKRDKKEHKIGCSSFVKDMVSCTVLFSELQRAALAPSPTTPPSAHNRERKSSTEVLLAMLFLHNHV